MHLVNRKLLKKYKLQKKSKKKMYSNLFKTYLKENKFINIKILKFVPFSLNVLRKMVFGFE